MRIEKILNNNVVLSRNEQGEEVVYMGCSLAFQKKIGDTINLDYVEKEFVLEGSAMARQFQQLFEDVPIKEVKVVKQIVDLAETTPVAELSSNIYLTLTDHIHYVLLRARERIDIPNPLVFETYRFYLKESEIAKQALAITTEGLGVQFSKNGAGFIAFHIVNAEQGNGNMEVTMEATKVVRDILTTISRHFGQVFDEDSLSYQWIITYLQYFVQHCLKQKTHDEEDEFLFALVQGKYPKAFQAIQHASEYLLKSYDRPIDQAEMIYLTIHIQRVVNDKKA